MTKFKNIDMFETVTYNTNVHPEIPAYYIDHIYRDPMDFINHEEFRLAGNYLNKKLTKLCPGFKWLKCNLYETSFDHMTFIYKNTVFSVLLKVNYNGEEIVDEEQERIFLKQTKSNCFVPCIFPITVEETSFSKKISIKSKKSFNLFDYETGANINPAEIASDHPARRSWYELGLISAEVITKALKEKKHILLSEEIYYDPDSAKNCPILTWDNEKKEVCRCAVKYFKSFEDWKAADIDKIPECKKNRHNNVEYFAPVIIDCKKESAYRNNDMNIYYFKDIFMKIHDAK